MVDEMPLSSTIRASIVFLRTPPILLLLPSTLYQALVCLSAKVISCVYVALPIKGPSLAGTAGCEAPWVGVDKDVMAAWPSIFNSSGDFFRPPCHRLSVTTHCWPVTPAHQAKPNGTSFCGQTPSRQRWPTFCCSETPLGMAARSHRDHPGTLAQTQTMPIRSISVLALVLFIARCHLLGFRILCFNGDMCPSAMPPQRLG
ncbi:hypothetical protein BDP55DRAFT_378368 [Colletotrichum godetiae]|uniref:Uncharacterized protein n=1 Tax=Colletotrichum godetiae TaxID=1209918 RepID=A0AAJ0AVJ3_9PEZI|nr:uncharacterized protein BDP55DRAFT_378368 [Colletotrichum godetiae]KAK1689776.1 hypothetical protein BDP55DRAFT_378368 [Colletotrichum godetiae]